MIKYQKELEVPKEEMVESNAKSSENLHAVIAYTCTLDIVDPIDPSHSNNIGIAKLENPGTL